MERWIRRGVDLLVPASMSSSTSSTPFFSLSSSPSSTTKRPSSVVAESDEDLRLKWLVVILTTSLFLCFQLLCLLSFLFSPSSSTIFYTFTSASSSSSLWAVAACAMSMAIELGLVWTLYATRDLPLVAAGLAGAINAFVLYLALVGSGGAQLLGSSDLFAWLIFGPLLVFFVCGGRSGLYATAAVALQSIIFSTTFFSTAAQLQSSSLGASFSSTTPTTCCT